MNYANLFFTKYFLVVWEININLAFVIKKQNMATKEKVDVRDTITDWLKENDRSMAWLAEKTGINYNTLYSILTQKLIKMSAARLEAINNFLGTKFKK